MAARLALALGACTLCYGTLSGCASIPKAASPPEKDIDGILSALGIDPDKVDHDYGPEDPEGPGSSYDFPITPYTDMVFELSRVHGAWQARAIQVPDYSGAFPLICFKIKGRQLLDCLYRVQRNDAIVEIWVKSGVDT